MDEAVARLYLAFRQAMPEGDFSAFKERAIQEANKELHDTLKRYRFSEKLYRLPTDFTTASDLSAVVRFSQEYDKALAFLNSQLHRIVKDGIVMDAFSFSSFGEMTSNGFVADISTATKAEALAKYLSSFRQKGAVAQSLPYEEALLNSLYTSSNIRELERLARQSNIANPSSQLSDLRKGVLDSLRSEKKSFYVSERLLDQPIAARRASLERRALHDKRWGVVKERLLKEVLPLTVILLTSLTFFFIFYLTDLHISDFTWGWWFLYIPLSLLMPILFGALMRGLIFPNSRLGFLVVRKGKMTNIIPSLIGSLTITGLLIVFADLLILLDGDGRGENMNALMVILCIVVPVCLLFSYAFCGFNDIFLDDTENVVLAIDYALVTCFLPPFLYLFHAHFGALITMSIFATIGAGATMLFIYIGDDEQNFGKED